MLSGARPRMLSDAVIDACRVRHLALKTERAYLSEALRTRLAAAEAERATLRAQLATRAAPRPAVDLDGLAARWRRMVMDLGGVLAGEDRERARGLLADLLGPVTIGTDAATGDVYAELDEPAERLLVQAVGAPLRVVAGARNTSRRRVILPRRR